MYAIRSYYERRTDATGAETDPLQAALVAVDPSTGELTAMVGGRGYGETQFNLV